MFVSASQQARSDTEAWAAANMFCPNCGCPSLEPFEANRPVADLYCPDCSDQYELKSQSKRFGKSIANGAYETKMERLASDTSPNLILLHYDRKRRIVENMILIPKGFFVGSTVERRPPLGPNARRAGWVGSNIRLDRIPETGRIPVILDGIVRERDKVLRDWQQTKFVTKKSGEARGWLVDVMRCVDMIGRDQFRLADVYAFERDLADLYPDNANIRPKIRQQLQVLRDNGYLHFLGDGRYRLR